MSKQFGNKGTWEDFYTDHFSDLSMNDLEQKKDYFDWYQTFEGVKDVITDHIDFDSLVLNIGCGNSKLSEDMYKEGYTNIINIDWSEVCIEYMKKKYDGIMGKKFKYLCLDILDDSSMNKIPDEYFDCVIDKGCLDSVLCGLSSTANAKYMLKNVYKKLKPGGRYICVSHGIPETRQNFLILKNWSRDLDWHFQWTKLYKNRGKKADMPFEEGEVQTASVHYAYVCKKPIPKVKEVKVEEEEEVQEEGQEDQQPQEEEKVDN